MPAHLSGGGSFSGHMGTQGVRMRGGGAQHSTGMGTFGYTEGSTPYGE